MQGKDVEPPQPVDEQERSGDSTCVQANGELPERQETDQADQDLKGGCAPSRVDCVRGVPIIEDNALEGGEPSKKASDDVRARVGQLGTCEGREGDVGVGHHRPEHDV